ncbi:hypothetical protein H8B06_00895 [Sphingobacterium sp. DN00404]|uniref:Lipocalin-like domain-containing protein n=1 Tax=Sphingobacterium micropteri TaxID=2763501 RepID=A0ABR7YJ73_9SPHI|nr:hypothetical protein [Sphingobacterium micropteri]MBD1431367.1 hypothetical protein [Sphingobacterium micropteri]
MNNLKNTLFVTIAFLALIATQSCSKDDNPSPEPEPEETVQKIELEGMWTITSVNFLDETANWDNAVAFTSESGLGWAPNMYGKTMGINFQTTAVNDESNTKLGSKFSFIVGEDLPLSESDNYWYWNYVDEQESFEMKQLATATLPYDFSLLDISDVKTENDGDKIVFQAKINSRKPGGEATETLQVPVEISIAKGTPSAGAAILLKGHPFVMPELELTEEENQAVLIAELQEVMGFNSNALYKMYMPAEYYWITTIEGVDLDKATLILPADESNHMPSAPFVVIDKNNTLFLNIRGYGSGYEKFKVSKEGDIYTLWGEHADCTLYGQTYAENSTYRIKVTFDTETKETVVLRELLNEGMVYIDYAISWTKDLSITTTSSWEGGWDPYAGVIEL